MAFLIKPGQTVLFTGDSITDCGRRNNAAPLGAGYVQQVADLIAARYPDRRLRLVNTGVSGHTVRNLRDRWTDDVIRHRPDWLSVMIGINDIDRWLRKTPESVSPEEYATLYDAVLARTAKETKARLILIEPFYISTDRSAGSWRGLMLSNLAAYVTTVRRLARKYRAIHVPMHAVFARQLRHVPAERFCPEPVHPNTSGHLVIAHEWLRAVGW